MRGRYTENKRKREMVRRIIRFGITYACIASIRSSYDMGIENTEAKDRVNFVKNARIIY